jgi:hypothetical protein
MWQSFSSVSAIELEGQFEVGLELLVRDEVVARHAEDHRTGLDEVLVVVAELHGLGGAAGRVVLRVEVQHHRLAEEGLRGELHAAGGDSLEFRKGFVDGVGSWFWWRSRSGRRRRACSRARTRRIIDRRRAEQEGGHRRSGPRSTSTL